MVDTREFSTQGAVAVAGVLLLGAGVLFWGAVQPRQVDAVGEVVVPQDCQSFEFDRPATLELRTDADHSAFQPLSDWQAMGGGSCAAGFAFTDVGTADRYTFIADQFRGEVGYSSMGGNMVVPISWSAPPGPSLSG